MASAEPGRLYFGLPVVLAPRAGSKRPVRAKGTLLVPYDAVVRQPTPGSSTLIVPSLAPPPPPATLTLHPGCCTSVVRAFLQGSAPSWWSLSISPAMQADTVAVTSTDPLFVWGKCVGKPCLATAERWAHCHGGRSTDLYVGRQKHAKPEFMLRVLREQPLTSCRPPLFEVLRAQVQADSSLLDLVGWCRCKAGSCRLCTSDC